MRTEREMMELLIGYAERDARIRLVTMEGSRTNPNIAPDLFQDYDISYFVTEMDSFKASDAWLDVFGERLIMQKPEDMELFPPELGGWFSYLMLFRDGVRVDLKLVPVQDVKSYFGKSDGLVRVLLDKDALVQHEVVPTDRLYWIRKPTAREYDDCCNEFWWVTTYVVKGLARREILYATDHLHGILHPNLLRMMGWKIGSEQGFNFSLGKNCKFIDRYLPSEDWQKLLSTCSMSGYEEMWRSLFLCCEQFRSYSKAAGANLGYPYPDYDEAVTGYIERIYSSYR